MLVSRASTPAIRNVRTLLIFLPLACTFLGPSRKRGPPKGYIDAIEARLHQTEALLGIILATRDPRAQNLIRDIAKDPLAKEIIDRVDQSAYGVQGRKWNDAKGGAVKTRHHASESSRKTNSSKPEVASTQYVRTLECHAQHCKKC